MRGVERRSLLARWRACVVPAALLLVVACEPTNWTRKDEFPEHLAQGCSSERECKALIAEAADRLDECRQDLVGNGVRYRAHATGRVHDYVLHADVERCAYEVADVRRAFAQAKAWDERRDRVPHFSGDPRYLATTPK